MHKSFVNAYRTLIQQIIIVLHVCTALLYCVVDNSGTSSL